MKTFLIFCFSIFLIKVQAIDAYVSNAIFYTPEKTAYCESQQLFRFTSVTAQPKNTGKQASVTITVLFKKEDKIINYDKYEMESPLVVNNDSTVDWLYSLKRYPLNFGKYQMEITFQDNYNPSNTVTFNKNLEVESISDVSPQMSDAVFIESVKNAEPTSNPQFVKYGLEINPYAFDYFPKSMEKVGIFVESFNIKSYVKEGGFLAKYYIENADSKTVLEHQVFTKKYTPEIINVYLQMFDISQIPSGNYNVVVELIDKKNQIVVQKKRFFQRNNSREIKLFDENLTNLDNIALTEIDFEYLKDYNEEMLNDAIRATVPIMRVENNSAVTPLVKSNDIKIKKNYIARFWKATNPENPKKAFEDYMEIVRQVDELYGTSFRKGYQTDRGRVFLRYGAPDFKDLQRSSSEFKPHEKWIYYRLVNYGNQANVFFLFYDPDNSSDYRLLHSTARGEVREDRYLKIMRSSYSASQDNLGSDKLNFQNTDFLNR